MNYDTFIYANFGYGQKADEIAEFMGDRSSKLANALGFTLAEWNILRTGLAKENGKQIVCPKCGGKAFVGELVYVKGMFLAIASCSNTKCGLVSFLDRNGTSI